jgi:SAM-dependent methyltransferase
MTTRASPPGTAFDEYTADYDMGLARGLSVSGEDKAYFAHGRVAWLTGCLAELAERPQSVLDFGCGNGSTSPFFFDLLGTAAVVGVDISARSIAEARQRYGSGRAQFLMAHEHCPKGRFDLAYCNGVFHHIPPAGRAAAVAYLYRSLRPGGLLALWENNPWNPGTRYVMRRIPFDRDAVPLAAPETRRLLRAGGFAVLRTDFLFLFPRFLRWFRWLEPLVARLPLGAQYQVLSQKPCAQGTA